MCVSVSADAGHCYVVWDSLRFVYAGDSCSDLDTAQARAQVSARACSSSDDDAHHADSEVPSRSIEVTQPALNAVAGAAGGTVEVAWATAGPVEAERTVMLSLWHGEHNIVTLGSTANTGSAVVTLPSAEYLQYFTNVLASGRDDTFRIRIDVQHAAEELSGETGWSDRLVGYSPVFSVSGLL